MTITRQYQDFELMEMTEPNKNITFGILGLFRVHYIIFARGRKIDVEKTAYYDFIEYEYITYFCDQENDLENRQIAIKCIINQFK